MSGRRVSRKDAKAREERQELTTMAKTQQTLRQRFRAALALHGMSATQAAAHIGELAPSTVWNWLAETKSETGRIRVAVELFLRRLDRGDIGGARGELSKVIPMKGGAGGRHRERPRRPRQHYEVAMVRQVASTIDFAVENDALVLVTADFGAGKTYAARQWRREAVAGGLDVLFFEFIDPTANNKRDFLNELAVQLGVDDHATNANATGRLFNAIITRLREQPAVLIFDQCEAVSVRILQIVRQIWDAAREEGVAVVLLAAPQLLIRLERGRAGDLGALRSRIGARVGLSGVTREEMASIVKAEGVIQVDDDAFELLYQAVGGSMRWLMEAVDMLTSRHQGKRVTERTIIGVCRRLLGVSMTPLGGRGKGRAAAVEAKGA